ncbi:hypothetical protein [Phenylobacterium sp.]|uniref:hypothetical protein n=1 Tax=Phenylobacterium sp. TaxID=1871053 RepID=UPI001229B994|nr:hypothetical protein [Phenylobacterium sp.]THD63239.1 MAG: hypothetical protein E8A12_08895 [Phenylobacterium sp.]
MRIGHRMALLTGAAVVASAATAQPAQKVTGPVAVYWMSASTQSGFGMPGAGGGGRPSMSQIMGMMNGGGGAQHSLVLQLGSSEHPAGDPSAEHLPPTGLGAGPSLPLVSPEAPPTPTPREEPPEKPQIPQEYQKPKGRMLIFWGCGEHAKPGQPVVLDFAEMSAGKIPPGMSLLSKGLDIRRMQPPSPGRYAAYGDWPNAKSRTTVPGTGSLVGQHTVHGDYSPEIKFSLDPNQDFLGPLVLTTNTKTPGGPAQLGWAPVSGAEAYAATVVGAGGGRGGGDATVVLWSSSDVEAAAFGLPDYIAPGDLARGVENRTLMGPQTTSCQVPKEVVDAAPQGFLQMVAYGREANFVYPPRPADPKIAWNRQWEVKVRYRSATGGLLGMTMPGMGGGRAAAGATPVGAQPGQDQPPPDPAAARRRAILNGLGGLIPH